MLKRTISFAVALVLSAGLYAQDKSNIGRVSFLQPKAGETDKFLAGVKEHTNKYHKKDGHKIRTYRIASGPKTGWFVRYSQAYTWADLDKYTTSDAHVAHAAKTVTPYVGENIGPMYWAYLEDLSYNPDTSGKPSKMVRVNFTHVNPLMDGDYIELRRQLKEAHEKTNSDDSFSVFQLVHGGKMHTYAQGFPMNSWSEVPTSGGAQQGSIVNEVFGERAWGQFMSKGREIIYKRNDEMWIYMKDHSTR